MASDKKRGRGEEGEDGRIGPKRARFQDLKVKVPDTWTPPDIFMNRPGETVGDATTHHPQGTWGASGNLVQENTSDESTAPPSPENHGSYPMDINDVTQRLGTMSTHEEDARTEGSVLWNAYIHARPSDIQQ